ncbi:DUF1533 domain-containing protein [Paenibacillus sp. WQ 127069]|uniref:DUF1533 domain-containing protein n=1 Tax=Paenibacillus baimaensis TaxID=2982185 RepID=A0ABT2UMW6_9BACL|nr:hemoblobin-interacting domain-containing protein [Paenibacillus sp. WQ 127069]MCU6795992.1 DUF1533 domain-containing protein [Paenibacillus sp. WQ 127069]
MKVHSSGLQRWGRERRRYLCMLLSFALLFTALLPISGFGAAVANADPLPESDLINESFDGMATGSTPANWGVSVTGSSYVKVAERPEGGRFLQIYDASKQATQGITKTFTSQTGKLTVQADVQLPAGATAGKENMLFYILDSANKPAIALNLQPDKIITYRTVSGVTTSTTLATGLPLNGWRSLIVAADYSSKTYDFYLGGSLIQSGVPFRYDDAVNLSKLQVAGAYYADNANYIRIVNLDQVAMYSGAVRLLQPPVLAPDVTNATVGQPVDLAFTDSASWRAAISGVAIDGATVSGSTYTVGSGNLHIGAAAFPTAKSYQIVVKAAGYVNAAVTQQVYAATVTDLVYESFNSITVGTTPSQWGAQTTGSSYVQVKEKPDGDRYLQIYDASKMTTEGINKSFASQTGKLTIQADVQLPTGATAGKENALFYMLDSAGKAAIALSVTPDKITSFRTVGTTTTTTNLVTGLPLHGWRSITVAADFAAKTFDFYLDGELKSAAVPFRYDDAANIAKLKVSGASYADDANYIRIVNLDNVHIYVGEPKFPAPDLVTPPAPGVEKNSFDSYSSVFLSSRWWRTDGMDGQLGTLDALKRFMATDDKWSYITDKNQISNIVRQGVGFQGTLNMNMGSVGRAKYFDGTPIVAPWMTWGATWGSMSDPLYYQAVLNVGKQSIDAGAASFQFDDWRGSVDAYKFGGDFCDPCMEQFRQYLDDNYSDMQLSAWGVSDISTFNYKTFLQTTLDVQTNGDYINKKILSPLDGAFSDFNYKAAIGFHTRMKQDLEAYAGTTIEYSNNAPFIKDSVASKHFLHDAFNYGMGENDEDSMTIDNMVTNGSLSSGLGKPHIISPLPYHEAKIREGIAASYALGQYMLVPWDAWLQGSTRYFGTVEQYGDLFHFIRQYPFLFDGQEPSAKVGILVKWSDMNFATLSSLSMKLFKAGVPFRILAANDSLPAYALREQSFEGLDTLIEYAPTASFSAADQLLISNSGATVLGATYVDSSWLAARSQVSVTGGEQLYATVRSPEDTYAPKVIHLLNRTGLTAEDIEVTLADSAFFGGSNLQAVLYRPGHNPLELTVTNAASGKHKVTVPSLEEWGIVRVGSGSSITSGDVFNISAPWSGIAIGNPAPTGSASSSGSTVTVTSSGAGLHVPSKGDMGSSDQFSYVYEQIHATPLQDYSVSTRLADSTGAANGALTGLMLRETPASNAKFVAIANVAGNGLRLFWRDADNSEIGSLSLGQPALPGYVKLVRHSGTYSAYYSSDGIQWGAAIGTHNISLRTTLGGVFTAAGKGNASHTASFDSTVITYGEVVLPSGQLDHLTIGGLPQQLSVSKTAQATVTASIYNSGVETKLDITGEQIQFTSSDPSVAIISSSGIVSGIATGTATLTASFTANGVTATGTAAITVVPPNSVLLDETFDSYDVSELPASWVYSPTTVGGSYIQISETPSVSDKSLNIYDNSPGGFPSATASFEQQAGPFSVQFDFKVSFGTVKSNGGAIVAYMQSPSGTNGISLLVEDDGFWYLDGSTTVVAAPVVENQWYAIRIDLNPATRKMDLYIDGVKVVDQGNFRNAVDTISKIQVGGSSNGVDTSAFWNNVHISS